MPHGTYTTKADFRQFSIASVFSFPRSPELDTDGDFALSGFIYQDRLSWAFVSDGGLGFNRINLYGTNFVGSGDNLTSGTLQAIESVGSDDIVGDYRDFAITGLSVPVTAAMDAWSDPDRAVQHALLRLIYQGNDTITLSNFADYAFGANGHDTMVGNDGNDTLFGQVGNDVIRGGFGDDFISGDVGNDRLTGGPGADFLQGGAGNDTLTGAADADLFVFRAGYGSDTITDWTDGVDRIRLYGVINENQISITAIAGVGVRITAMDVSIVVDNADVEDFQLIRGTGLFALA